MYVCMYVYTYVSLYICMCICQPGGSIWFVHVYYMGHVMYMYHVSCHVEVLHVNMLQRL